MTTRKSIAKVKTVIDNEFSGTFTEFWEEVCSWDYDEILSEGRLRKICRGETFATIDEMRIIASACGKRVRTLFVSSGKIRYRKFGYRNCA
jgi:hypothetical protein